MRSDQLDDTHRPKRQPARPTMRCMADVQSQFVSFIGEYLQSLLDDAQAAESRFWDLNNEPH